MSIIEWRQDTAKKLTICTQTPQLDAELMLMHVLKKSRAQLYADPQTALQKSEEKKLNALLTRRLRGEPMAYLLGSQSFWRMELTVTPDTLIPRPETECLIEWILKHYVQAEELRVADLGTGSGAIAVALALEKPGWKITATDQWEEALAIAKRNTEKYALNNIAFYAGDWFDALPDDSHFDLIVSNPPYIAKQDPHLKQLTFEPRTALAAGEDGLSAIHHIVHHAPAFLHYNGYLVVEHGYDQAEVVTTIFANAGFHSIENHRDLADVPRFVTGKV